MKKHVVSNAILIVGLIFGLAACSKKDVDTGSSLPKPNAPVANAGKDTTIYLPFTTYSANAFASSDPDLNIVSYNWRCFAGPSNITMTVTDKIKVHVEDLVKEGKYELELTVTDADGLTSKDTVNITVRPPNYNGLKREYTFKDLSWTHPWFTQISIPQLFSALPENSYVRNIYIKRDAANTWETVVPLDIHAPGYGELHSWEYYDGVLIIYPKKNDSFDDTPDVKIEYYN